ncbi:MAG: anti-sigma factor family protein [Actinomycetota bacterium]
MSDMTHERCSELLPRLLAGGLGADDAIAVELHLEGCPECRLELKGLSALAEGLTPLTDFERARLRHAVRAGLPHSDTASQEASPLWRKAAPFLSAAAALLILGFGIASLELGGADEGSDSAAGGTETSDELQGSTEDAGQAAPEGPDSVAAGEPAGVEGNQGTEAADGALSETLQAVTAPDYRSGGSFNRLRRLEHQAQTRDPYKTASQTYDPGAAGRDRRNLLSSLERSANLDGRSGKTLRACAETIFAGSTAELLPVFGAFGKLNGRSALVLGFIAASADVYDRYLLAVSSPPGDCGTARLLRGRLR